MCLCELWFVSSTLCLPTLWSVSLSVSLSTYPVVCLCPSLDLPTLWSVSVRPFVYLPCGLSLCPFLCLPTLWSVSVRPSIYLSCGLSLCPSLCLPTLRGGQKVQIQELPACRLSGFRPCLGLYLPVPPSGLATSWLLCRSPAGVAVADLRRRYVSACPTEAGLHVAACVPWRACRLSLHTLHQKQAF